MLSLRIALRYLFSKKSHSAVNIISFISMAGVAVATIAIVCVLSVFNGFDEYVGQRMSMLDPQLSATRADERVIENADSVASKIAKVPGVEMALPTLSTRALAVYGDRQMPVMLRGVPSGYDRLTSLNDVIIDGQYVGPEMTALSPDTGYATPRSMASLSIGTAAGLSSGDGFSGCIALYVPRRLGTINPANPMGAFSADSVAVSSIFQVNQPEYDTDLMILPIDDVRTLLEYDNNEASAIEIGLKADADETASKARIEQILGQGWVVKDRVQQQQQAFRMIEIEKWITFLLLAFILIVASFNIISTLSILIIEKESNITTLAALGAPRRLIARIFTLEGWLVTLGGGIIGIVVGVLLCLAQQIFGFIKLAGDPSQLNMTAYPVKVEAPDLLIVAGLLILVCLLATGICHRFIKAKVRS